MITDTDNDGMNDGDEVAQGSNPADASDQAKRPLDPVEPVTFRIFGDWAAWEMTIQGQGPRDQQTYKLVNPKDGVSAEATHPLKRNNKYRITLKHTGTRPNVPDTWYCIEAKVGGLPSVQTFEHYNSTRLPGVAEIFTIADGKWVVDNRSGLLSAHHHKDSSPDGGGNVAESLEAFLLPVDLDVNGDGDLADACDGIAKYMPGYELTTAKLHSGTSFETAQYAGPQAMNLIIDNLPSGVVDQATVRIVSASDWAGYCGNGAISNESLILPYKDFSLAGQETVDASQQLTVSITGNKMVIPIHCHDYGAWCDVEITLNKNGSAIDGAPMRLTLPHDGNSDRLADIWQDAEIHKWNVQFGELRPLNETERGRMKPGAGTTLVDYADDELADADGGSNGDGGRNLPAMAAAGDGLKSIVEYRGYVLDGGPGIAVVQHKRLSVSRKELLVECSEANEIKVSSNNGLNTNPAISSYDFTSMMKTVSDFYRDPNDGAGIDLFWCRDTFFPLKNAYNYIANPSTKFDAFFEQGQAEYSGTPGVTPDPVTFGGNTIYRDEKWFSENALAHDVIYGGNAGTSILEKSRNDETLGDFVKLFLGHRRTKVMPQGSSGRMLRIEQSLAATFDGDDTYGFDHTGSWVYVSGIADENHWDPAQALYSQGDFTNILSYSVAHELAHLVIDAGGAPGWTSDEHTSASNGSLMAYPPIKNLGVLDFTVEEISKIHLPNRVSIFSP